MKRETAHKKATWDALKKSRSKVTETVAAVVCRCTVLT